MKSWFIMLSCIILAVITSACTKQQTDEPALFQGTYSYQADLANTGTLTTKGVPKLNGVLWKLKLDHSTHSSPVLSDGILYVGDEGGHLYAINANDGTIIWQQAFEGKIRSSAAIYEKHLYFTDTSSILYAVHKDTGNIDWSCQLDSSLAQQPLDTWDYYISSPAVDKDVIYVGSESPYFYAISRHDGSILWQHSSSRLPIHGKAAIADGTIFIASMTGRVSALDQHTGEEFWHRSFGIIQSSITYKDGLLYAGSRDQNVYALDAATGSTVWTQTSPDGSWVISTPAVTDQVVAIGSSNSMYLHVYDRKSGQSIFDFEAGSRVFGSPVIVDHVIYFGTAYTNYSPYKRISDAFYAVDLYTGEQLWRFDDAHSPILSSPIIADGVLFFTTLDGYVYALN